MANRLFICGCVIIIMAGSAAFAQTAPANAPATPTPSAAGAAVPPDVQTALQMPPGPDQLKALTTAANNWAQTDPVAALSWCLDLPSAQGAVVAQPLAGTCGKVNGKASAELLLQKATPLGWRCMHGVVLLWGETDHDAAIAWALQSPPIIHDLAVFSAVDGWCRKDAPASAAWTAKMESAKDRNPAIQAVALMWARASLDAVTPWVQQLKGDDLKVAAQTIAQDWRFDRLTDDEKKSGLTASQWLAKLPLSAADQDAVLKAPPLPSMFPQDQKPAAKT